MAHYGSSFSINRLCLDAQLGVYDGERAVRQPVEVSLRWYFAGEPDCMRNDHAAFIDYAAIAGVLHQAVETREFRLIEYMARELFCLVRAYLDEHGGREVRLWMKLTKCRPDVRQLEEGASFTLCDLPADATLAPVA